MKTSFYFFRFYILLVDLIFPFLQHLPCCNPKLFLVILMSEVILKCSRLCLLCDVKQAACSVDVSVLNICLSLYNMSSPKAASVSTTANRKVFQGSASVYRQGYVLQMKTPTTPHPDHLHNPG